MTHSNHKIGEFTIGDEYNVEIQGKGTFEGVELEEYGRDHASFRIEGGRLILRTSALYMGGIKIGETFNHEGWGKRVAIYEHKPEAEVWQFTIQNHAANEHGFSKQFTRELSHDDDLGTPFEQAELIAYGLQRKYPKCNVNADAMNVNSFIACPTLEDFIDEEVFKAKNREKPIDLSSLERDDVEYRVRRAFKCRFNMTNKMEEQIDDLSRRVLQSDAGEGAFMHEIGDVKYHVKYDHYSEKAPSINDDWFDIEIEVWEQ